MVTMKKIPDCDSLFVLIYSHASNSKSFEISVMVQLQLLGRFLKMEIAIYMCTVPLSTMIYFKIVF